MLIQYEKSKLTKYGSPFSRYYYGFKSVNEISRRFRDIEEIIKIMRLGIDVKKYTRFQQLTPLLCSVLGNTKPTISRKDRDIYGKLTLADVDFCINFILESALTLQEFDYTLNI